MKIRSIRAAILATCIVAASAGVAAPATGSTPPPYPTSIDGAISVAQDRLGLEPSSGDGVMPRVEIWRGGRTLVDFGLPRGSALLEVLPTDASQPGSLTADAHMGRTVMRTVDESVTAATQKSRGGGVNFFSVLKSRAAPTSYSYEVGLGQESEIHKTPDGGAVVVNADKSQVVQIKPAWAIDADGRPVPTHYEVVDNRLTQIVDHRSGKFSYPIVADPSFQFRFFGGKIVFNRTETRRIAVGGTGAAASILSGCGFIPEPRFRAGCGTIGFAAGLAAAYFAAQEAANRCGVILLTAIPVPPFVTPAPDPGGHAIGEFGCF